MKNDILNENSLVSISVKNSAKQLIEEFPSLTIYEALDLSIKAEDKKLNSIQKIASELEAIKNVIHNK